MDNPATEVRRAVLECTTPDDANTMLAAVDKYFAEDAIFVRPFRSARLPSRSTSSFS